MSDRIMQENTWVKCIRNEELRYVTRYSGKDTFEDDGVISKQPPSVTCYDKHYELLQESEESPTFLRAGGDIVCTLCNKSYHRHRQHLKYKWLNIICDGILVKL